MVQRRTTDRVGARHTGVCASPGQAILVGLRTAVTPDPSSSVTVEVDPLTGLYFRAGFRTRIRFPARTWVVPNSVDPAVIPDSALIHADRAWGISFD